MLSARIQYLVVSLRSEAANSSLKRLNSTATGCSILLLSFIIDPKMRKSNKKYRVSEFFRTFTDNCHTKTC